MLSWTGSKQQAKPPCSMRARMLTFPANPSLEIMRYDWPELLSWSSLQRFINDADDVLNAQESRALGTQMRARVLPLCFLRMAQGQSPMQMERPLLSADLMSYSTRHGATRCLVRHGEWAHPSKLRPPMQPALKGKCNPELPATVLQPNCGTKAAPDLVVSCCSPAEAKNQRQLSAPPQPPALLAQPTSAQVEVRQTSRPRFARDAMSSSLLTQERAYQHEVHSGLQQSDVQGISDKCRELFLPRHWERSCPCCRTRKVLTALGLHSPCCSSPTGMLRRNARASNVHFLGTTLRTAGPDKNPF